MGTADISLLSCGTDGIDGCTEAAGAIGSPNLVSDDDRDPLPYLRENDSHGFYTKYRDGEYLIRVGHTGTNVMDLHVLIVTPR